MLPERWANDAQKKCYFANFQTFLLNSRQNQTFATLLNIQELSQIGEPNFQKLEIQFRCQWPYFSVRLWRHFVNFWVKIKVIKHMLS